MVYKQNGTGQNGIGQNDTDTNGMDSISNQTINPTPTDNMIYFLSIMLPR